MRHRRRAFLVVLSVGVFLWSCGNEEPLSGPQHPDAGSMKIVADIPERPSVAREVIDLDALREPKGLGLARRTEANARLIANWPADTAYEKCQEQDGENCEEQGETWTGQFYVHCLSEQCDPELTYTWELKTPPPGVEVSFDPAVTTIEERTTMSIEIDNDAETGVFESSVAAPPSGPDLPFTFHTLCSWGLGTCPYIEIRDLMGVGNPSVSVSAAGEQSTRIGKRMHLKVQHKTGTGEHQFEQEEQGWLIQWDGTGNLIHGYDITAAQLQLYPWPQDIGLADTISYYHVTPNQYVVWAQADLNYDDDEAEVRVLTKAVFNVDGPTNMSMTSVTVDSGVTLGPFLSFPMAIHFGTVNPPGIGWTFTATAPSGDNGYVAATQLVNAVAHRTDVNGNQITNFNSNGYWLDGCPLYDDATQRSGSQYTWTSGDSPGLGFTASDSMGDIAMSFQTYFMYRPGGFHSIWVPLGLMAWNFDGTAARQGTPGVWQLSSASASVNPSGSATSIFPVWANTLPSMQSCSQVPTNLIAPPEEFNELMQLGEEVSP